MGSNKINVLILLGIFPNASPAIGYMIGLGGIFTIVFLERRIDAGSTFKALSR